MAFDEHSWEQHVAQATVALTWRDKMARNGRRSGTSGSEGELDRERQLWEDKANHHLWRLARMAEEAPDPAIALRGVEKLRRWSGLSREDLPDGHARRIPMLLGAAGEEGL